MNTYDKLLNAIITGDLQKVESIIENEHISESDLDNWGAVLDAIDHDQPDIVELIIQKGVNIDLRKRGTTPLIQAIKTGNQVIVELLLELGANISLENPQHESFEENMKKEHDCHSHTPGYLCEQVVMDVPGTPLMWAATKHPSMVTLLLEKGADVDEANWDDQTALEWAIRTKNLPTITLLIQKGGNISDSYMNFFQDQDYKSTWLNVRSNIYKTVEDTVKEKIPYSISSMSPESRNNFVRHLLQTLDWKRDFQNILLSIQAKHSTQDSKILENLLLNYELRCLEKSGYPYVPLKATKDLIKNSPLNLIEVLTQENASFDPNTLPQQSWQNYLQQALGGGKLFEGISACVKWEGEMSPLESWFNSAIEDNIQALQAPVHAATPRP